MSRPSIKTQRLLLRELTSQDTPRIAELGSDWDVASMTARMPYPYTLDAAKLWVDGLAAGEQVFAIEFDGALIGVAGFTANPYEASAEMGYWLGKDFWGRGFATEAAQALIDHCFRKEGHTFMVCGHFSDNPASSRVIEKLGFERTGVVQHWCEATQTNRPAIRYKLQRPQSLLQRLTQFTKR
jgi:ribosomal-protein-alanine N-acetyltransferase